MRRVVGGLLLSGGVLVGAWQLGRHALLVTNVGQSMPAQHYLCWPLPADAPLQAGTTVLFHWPDPWRAVLTRLAPKVDVSLPCLKHVAGVPGDQACWHEDRLTVRTSPPVALPLLAQYPFPARHGCQVLEADELLVLGIDTRSVDSRYLGPLPRASLIATCVALW